MLGGVRILKQWTFECVRLGVGQRAGTVLHATYCWNVMDLGGGDSDLYQTLQESKARGSRRRRGRVIKRKVSTQFPKQARTLHTSAARVPKTRRNPWVISNPSSSSSSSTTCWKLLGLSFAELLWWSFPPVRCGSNDTAKTLGSLLELCVVRGPLGEAHCGR